LSEMIHNPQVNADLQNHGVRFMQDNYGKQLISFDELTADDIVIIPAFGTTLQLEKKLKAAELKLKVYDKLIEITNRDLDQDIIKKIEAELSRSLHQKGK